MKNRLYFDEVIIRLILGFLVIFFELLPPVERTSYWADPIVFASPTSIRDRIPTLALSIICLSTAFIPWVFMTIKGKDSKKKDNLIKYFLGWSLGFLLTMAFIHSLKKVLGELRPDFFSRCFPDSLEQFLVDDPTLKSLNLFKRKCDPSASASVVREGRVTCPSGHASHSFFCFGFLALYIFRHMDSDSPWKFSCPVALMLIPAYIAGTRVADNKHFLRDILIGSLIGLSFAVISHIWYFLLKSERVYLGGDEESLSLEEKRFNEENENLLV
eukprot:GHVP01053331.1.p1 GENE.GHVP01053331.1~~GHVP01053331.1.p1  ORF type:complete len:272 (+),score=32.51 GHVP01053331.1:256-1071(+)